MQKIFNYSFLFVFLVCGIWLIYLLANLSETTNGQLLYMFSLSMVSFIFYIMTEKEASEETQTGGYVTLLLVAVCVIIILFASSCSRYVSVDDAANGRARCGQHL